MVASVQSSTAAAAQASTTVTQTSETQDRFLRLLVTQMKNQDPLNPLDNAQVTSQMAQLSTVTGIEKLNATVAALSSSMMSAQSMQAAAMIDRIALVPGKQIELLDGKSNAAVELDQPADRVTVSIKDKDGNLVRTLELGEQEEGVVDFVWDGKDNNDVAADNGSYTFSATAILDGEKSTPTTLSYGLVGSVSLTSAGPLLGMGTLGELGLDVVRRIL
ncbi:MAG: flagellar hook assembly protein FlgD [Gammaproteobacteria bacterium]|nr:flagellar hook assembly protein FlgD [Gammaproteobacteria bacterium]MBU1776217.1 flagellar hook assembly protein FlgD [Gammaproteobacteria bacterium]MBU1968214.1 flagellar hook assembly protein FlgD [Gammaproteobacteria bacterium]